MSVAIAGQIWAEALARKQDALQKSKVVLPLGITSPELFEAALDDLTGKYANKAASKFIKDRLGPHFEQITSFNDALLTASQSAPYGGVIWGGLVVMMESTCRFSRSLDDIMTEIEALQASMPQFTEYMHLYASDGALQFCLRDIFEDYIDFCICVVRYTSKSPGLHMVRNMFSSSHIKGLNDVKKSIERHKARFAEKAEAAHRRNAELHHTTTLRLSKQADAEFASLHAQISPISNATRTNSSPSFSRHESHTSSSSANGSNQSFTHTVALKRNSIFTGREEELEQLRAYLNTPMRDNEPRSCAIHGIGGVGKTQLALEYTYRFRALYQAIFWLQTENTIELLKSFSAIGDKLNIIDDVNEGRRLSRIATWLETTHKRWLLVMDNLEDLDTVSTVWPATSVSSSAIIITTQRPCDSLRWTDFNIPLLPLTATSGSQLLLTQTLLSDEIKVEQMELAREISNSVGGLPLWINALGGFIAQSQCSLSECLAFYNSSTKALDTGMKAGSWNYDRAPSTVFDLAFSRLSEDSKALLFILAFLNPDGVPEAMLSIDQPETDLAVLDSSNRQRLFSAIANLRQSQLVKREGQKTDTFLTTHRSIQTAIQHKLDRDLTQRQKSFQNTCRLLRQVFPRPSPLQQPESDKWPLIQMYLPQLLSLEKAFLQVKPPIEGSMDLAVLLSDVGLNVWDRGLNESAGNLLLTAEKVLDSIGCDEWAMERSDIYVILGILTDTVGITQRKEGLRYREQARKIRKHYIDSIPPDQLTLEQEIRYYNTITDLACSHQQFNRYDEIEATCEMVIKKYQSWGTEEEFPYEYAKYYHHKAFIFAHRGDTAAAVEHACRATKLLELGAFGLLATVFKFDCATLYFQNGQAELAISEHEKVLKHRLLKLGASNIMTIQSYLMLGAICYFNGDLTRAEENIREALKRSHNRHICRETTVRAKFYMSLVLKAVPNTKETKAAKEARVHEARSLATDARAGLNELLPLDHPDFLTGRDPDDPILYDYLAPWTNRAVVDVERK